MAFTRGANVVTDGLVLALDAANAKSYVSGSTVCRNIAGSTTGSLINGTAFSTDGLASFYFDGSDDYIDFGRFSVIEGIPQVSICHWVKTINNVNPYLFNTWFPDIVFIPNQFSMNVNDTTFANASVNASEIPLSTWMYVCGTYDGDRCRLYWNGSIVATGTSVPGVTPTSTNSLILGRKSAAPPLGQANIYVATGAIYIKALSTQEVLQNYNATKTRFGL